MDTNKEYPLKPKHALGCIDVGLRVVLLYQMDEIVAEYHFVKYPLISIETNYSIRCAYYKSQSTDPLKLSGVVTTLTEFDTILIRCDHYYTGRKRFSRVGLYALPYDWYECFETNKTERLTAIKQLVELGKKRGEEIDDMRKKERTSYW